MYQHQVTDDLRQSVVRGATRGQEILTKNTSFKRHRFLGDTALHDVLTLAQGVEFSGHHFVDPAFVPQ